MLFANGNGGANGLISRGDKRSSVANTNASHNKTASHSPRRGGGDNNSKERQKHARQHQPPQPQPQPQKISPVSTTSSSSSSSSGGIHPSQFASICREVAQVRDEHVAIRKSLSEREGELGQTRMALRNIAHERDFLRNKVSELERILKHSSEMYSHVASFLSNGQATSNQNSRTATSSPANYAIHNNHHSPTSAIVLNNNRTPPEQGNCTGDKSNSSLSPKAQGNNVLQQQIQKPTLSSASASSLPSDTVPFSSSTAGMPSPQKPGSGNEGHSNQGYVHSRMEKAGNPVQHQHPCPPSTLSSSSLRANINSQESHQPNNNNKKVEEKQQHSVHNYKNTNPSHNKGESIYSHEQQQKMSQVALSAPPFRQLELQNSNDRNENGNDVISPPMTNGNNNNNHLRSGVGGGGGGMEAGGGQQKQGQQLQHQQRHLSQSGITGLDLMLLGPDCSTKVVEHLVHPWAIESSVREIEHTLVLKGAPLNRDRLREVEIEIDRLNSRIDHLRSQNDVLTLNLEDAKSHADRLTELLGKYESNNVAMQLAIRYSDQMTDAYEVLVALLETEMGQVLANLHAGGNLHLICPPSSNNSTSPLNTSGGALVSRSGNNNNSNDNSPSEQAPPTGTGSNPILTESRNDIAGDRANQHLLTAEGESTTIVAVKTSNELSSNKIISPSSPSSSGVSCSPSSKSQSLIEQAKRNRLVAERAARFLLSRFSSSSSPSAPIQYSPQVTFPSKPVHNNGPFVYHSCQSESNTGSIISSSPSATSNLSNISAESGQDISPSGDRHQKDQSSTIITVEKDDGGVGTTPSPAPPEVTIGEERRVTMMMMMTTSSSPTTTTSSTFRAPSSTSFTPNGNEHPRDNSSVIPSLLPILGTSSTPNGSAGSGPTSLPSSSIEPLIRNLISSLRAERDAVKQTVIVELESESFESLTPSPKPSSPYYSNTMHCSSTTAPTRGATTTTPWSPADVRKLDLETAVLMQELMAMKEERAELRAQLFLVEKEKDLLELRLRSHESQEDAYKARINYLKSEIMDCKSLYSTPTMTLDTYHPDNRNRNEIIINSQQKNNGNNRNLETALTNNNNNNHNANWEREALLKKRIHELASTLERVTVSSEVREKENEEMINELNRANGILMQTLDVAKKKYQGRIKKMEDQILYISERHAAQMKLFGGRLPGMGKYHG